MLALVFVAYSLARVPRLGNYALGDLTAIGQASAVAARLAAGAHLYSTAVVPDAPGAPVVLALLQRLLGGPRLVHELWIAQLAELGLALVAYALATRLAGRLVGVLVAATTLVALESPLEHNADTSLAALLAWSSLALGARALGLGEDDPPARPRAAFLAAASATLAVAFDQSAGLGILIGWIAALVYLMSVRRGTARNAARRHAGAVLGGVAAGLASIAGLVLLAHGTPAGFARDAVADWFSLQAGPAGALANALGFAIMQRGAFPSSLVLTCLAFGIGWRVVHREGTLHVASSAPPRLGLRAAALVAALVAAVFGGAVVLLASGARLSSGMVTVGTVLAFVPTFGFVFAVASFFMQGSRASAELGDPGRRAGHLANAVFLAALCESSFERLSFTTLPQGRFGLAALTPIALCYLFLVLLRTGWRWAAPAVAALCMTALFGLHLSRALEASQPVESGYFAGLSVNVHGREMLRAKRRVDELCKPGDTVLVLPEDSELSLLFAHPRPPLRGASIQVQHYPERLVDEDLKALAAAPPKVVVLYPHRTFLWQALFALWPGGKGATRFVNGASKLLAKQYRVAGRFRATYVWDQDELVVYERVDDAHATEASP